MNGKTTLTWFAECPLPNCILGFGVCHGDNMFTSCFLFLHILELDPCKLITPMPVHEITTVWWPSSTGLAPPKKKTEPEISKERDLGLELTKLCGNRGLLQVAQVLGLAIHVHHRIHKLIPQGQVLHLPIWKGHLHAAKNFWHIVPAAHTIPS